MAVFASDDPNDKVYPAVLGYRTRVGTSNDRFAGCTFVIEIHPVPGAGAAPLLALTDDEAERLARVLERWRKGRV